MTVQKLRDLLPDSARPDVDDIHIGGCSLHTLAAQHGTPLYVYDEQTLRQQARRISLAFSPLGARISFASKACSTLAVLRVFHEEGLHLDVVSEGEIEAGLRAGFVSEDMHLHGNCKPLAEVRRAIDVRVRAIVLDGLDEARMVERLAKEAGAHVTVMLRAALPLEAETHPYLQTTGAATKFGIQRDSDEERSALDLLAVSSHLTLSGLHVHLGSQISDVGIYRQAGERLLSLAESLRGDGFPIEEVSIGGGWAVAYALGDEELAPEAVASTLAPAFAPHPHIRAAVEPGRALVARAGVAIYRVGSVKHSGTGRIIAVDGGMGDNPRPALYGSPYQPFLPARWNQPPAGPADVVGRYCESGDVIARKVSLPAAQAGDLLCVPVSGAYHLTMASAYNQVPPPAVAMVREGASRLITRRASAGELLSRDC